MYTSNFYSHNFDKKKRSNNSIKIIVIHYTGMQSERESLIRLCDPASKVSSHFVINRNGKIYRLVKDNCIAWHAGKSCWGKFKNINKDSVGIELVNKGNYLGYESFSKQQMLSLITICKKLIKKYKIKKKNIVGHSDISPLRKIDPGEKFPWKELSNNGIGTWHFCDSYLLKKNRSIKKYKKKEKINFIKNLKKIGYCFPNEKKSILRKIVFAFQRHYRKELINGIIDKECLLIAENLAKNS